jgi:hypothetical protein
MRWQMLDRVETFSPWSSATGRKAISFEEYGLLKPFGRMGVLPETLVLETGVQLARWVVMASSSFQETCVLDDVTDFGFLSQPSLGAVLRVAVVFSDRSHDQVPAKCHIEADGVTLAEGDLTLSIMPMAEHIERDLAALTWREIHATS